MLQKTQREPSPLMCKDSGVYGNRQVDREVEGDYAGRETYDRVKGRKRQARKKKKKSEKATEAENRKAPSDFPAPPSLQPLLQTQSAETGHPASPACMQYARRQHHQSAMF